MINLDTVGRMGDKPVSILGTGTADEWQHIFRGASYVTGVESRNVPESAEASDQMSFIEKGIPGIQIFTSAHSDYHRPSDTADKIDAAGLVKVATLAKEAVVYMGAREEPLTVTIERTGGQDRRPPNPPVGRARAGVCAWARFPTLPFRDRESRSIRFRPDLRPRLRVPGWRRPDADQRGRGHGSAPVLGDSAESLEPGQQIRATVLREGEEVSLEVSVEAR